MQAGVHAARGSGRLALAAWQQLAREGPDGDQELEPWVHAGLGVQLLSQQPPQVRAAWAGWPLHGGGGQTHSASHDLHWA